MHHRANFGKIGQPFAEILCLFKFSKLGQYVILHFQSLNVFAKTNFIKIGQEFMRYCNFSFFTAAILGFKNSEILLANRIRWDEMASLCQILSKLVNLLRRHSHFLIFQDGGLPILDF